MGFGGQVGKFCQDLLLLIATDSWFITKIGAELTDFVMVLQTQSAVKAFMNYGNVTLGGNVSGKFFIGSGANGNTHSYVFVIRW